MAKWGNIGRSTDFAFCSTNRVPASSLTTVCIPMGINLISWSNPAILLWLGQAAGRAIIFHIVISSPGPVRAMAHGSIKSSGGMSGELRHWPMVVLLKGWPLAPGAFAYGSIVDIPPGQPSSRVRFARPGDILSMPQEPIWRQVCVRSLTLYFQDFMDEPGHSPGSLSRPSPGHFNGSGRVASLWGSAFGHFTQVIALGSATLPFARVSAACRSSLVFSAGEGLLL
ncbi:MAG: hypothetical protein VR69_15630 [Peptococcaceae bacterium BRH_c4b]|nr:MAG: hypothetical protein VR69_15630 [Peptococcaceae bacterium BRH_c4b]